jgi:hypothetical protein
LTFYFVKVKTTDKLFAMSVSVRELLFAHSLVARNKYALHLHRLVLSPTAGCASLTVFDSVERALAEKQLRTNTAASLQTLYIFLAIRPVEIQ